MNAYTDDDDDDDYGEMENMRSEKEIQEAYDVLAAVELPEVRDTIGRDACAVLRASGLALRWALGLDPAGDNMNLGLALDSLRVLADELGFHLVRKGDDREPPETIQ